MPELDDYEAWPRIQPRGNIDAYRGEFYHWMRKLPAKIQGRELVNLAHLGYLVTIARQTFATAAVEAQTALVTVVAPSPAPQSAAGATIAPVKAGPSGDAAEQALVDEAVGDVLAVMPLEAMDGPPLH